MKIRCHLYPIATAVFVVFLASAFTSPTALQAGTPTPGAAPDESPQLYAGWDYAAMDAAIPVFHDGSLPLMKESLEADVEDYLHHDPDFPFYYYQFTMQGIDVYASVAPMDFWGVPFEEVCDGTYEDVLDPDLFMSFLDALYPAFVEDYGSWDASAFYDTVLFISKETDEYGDYTAFWPKDGGLTIIGEDNSVQYFYAEPVEWSQPLDWETLSSDEQALVSQGYTMIWRGLGEDGESIGRANHHDLETFLGIE